jgi:hypothetical protein
MSRASIAGLFHMTKKRAVIVLVAAILWSGRSLIAQDGPRADGDQVLDYALHTSMLTYDGKPFHAVMEITPSAEGSHPSPGPAYTGEVEVWWASSGKYRVRATSPEFSLDRTVDGDQLQEKYTGSFYPKWLETYIKILVDPVPVDRFKTSVGAVFTGGQQRAEGFTLEPCIRHDDKTNGITDDLTWGSLCFLGPLLKSVTTLNYSIYMKDWSRFDGKDIARQYDSYVLDNQTVIGRLTTLEPLGATDEDKISVASFTAAADLLRTEFVSTATEEGLLESAPKIDWPALHEGKTEGYMIVYARTDTTGQVRETSTHNSDNPGVEAFGMQQALKYKFKPLMVDGVAHQMEMPLVMHFTSHVENPLPILTVDEMKKQTIACRTVPIPINVLAPGEHAIVRLTIDPQGKILGSQPVSNARWGLMVNSWMSVKSCQFRPYVVNGAPVPYKGDVELR